MATDDNDRPWERHSSAGAPRSSRRAAAATSRDLGEHWNCPIVPQGGIVAATAARAMEAALGDPAQPLRSLNAVFAGQVRARSGRDRGRRAAARPVDVAAPRRRCATRAPTAGFDALAVFGAEREGFTFTDAEPPDGVTPPLECPSFRDPAPEGFEADRPWFNFWEHVEGRPTLGHAPWDDYEPESSLLRVVVSLRRPAPRRRRHLGPASHSSRSATPCRARSASGSARRSAGAAGSRRAPTSRCTSSAKRRCDWVLAVNRARHAGDGYASADMELWDVDGGRAAAGRLRHPDDGVQLPEIEVLRRVRESRRTTLATQSEPGVHLLPGKGLRGGPRRDGLPGAPGSARPSPKDPVGARGRHGPVPRRLYAPSVRRSRETSTARRTRTRACSVRGSPRACHQCSAPTAHRTKGHRPRRRSGEAGASRQGPR